MGPRLRNGELERLVLVELRAGPLPMEAVARRLNKDVNTVRSTMGRMAARGLIELYGTAGELGLDAPFAKTRCYGVPKPEDFDLDDDVGAAPAARPKSGGEPAPAPYATGFRWWNVSW